MEPSNFNVPNGIGGLSQEIMLKIVSEMFSVLDIQNFLAICKSTYLLKLNPRLSAITLKAKRDSAGRKFIVLNSVEDLESVLSNPALNDFSRLKLCPFSFEYLTPFHPTQIHPRMSSIALFFDFVPVPDGQEIGMTASIIADTSCRMWKRICTFQSPVVDPLRSAMKKWIIDLPMPPSNLPCVQIEANEEIACIMTAKGQLIGLKVNERGERCSMKEGWKVLPPFSSSDGTVMSSLGPSTISFFTVEENGSIIVILKNNAVFVYGDLSEYDEITRMKHGRGAIELTDSSKFKPCYYPGFISRSSSSSPSSQSGVGGPSSSSSSSSSSSAVPSILTEQGRYGIFGQHRIIKYFPNCRMFLTDEGIVFIRSTSFEASRSILHFTPLSPSLFFRNERIADVAVGTRICFISDRGTIIHTNYHNIDVNPSKVVSVLTTRVKAIPLPVPISTLRCFVLCYDYALLIR
eukprot:MONOS_13910.1-p1 / transcript=MONOS_13910.1 / gene=MONOS_13910 / organism=Monocercomonoides_exilis_PA203 / gene_product=unspecified product / transcript_product=unspecified product / location=Mono_scaffold00902:21757-24236(+) / protein_length=461 / sequence_SO=supercontig / SO=protein_coding / is_pseudo=false